jgi:hypothetical protein
MHIPYYFAFTVQFEAKIYEELTWAREKPVTALLEKKNVER